MEEFWYNFITIWLTIVVTLGSSVNLAVIVAVVRNRKLWKKQVLMILNVACADFLVATFGSVMPLVSSMYRGWSFGNVGCQIYAFAMNIVGITSETTLAFLALDRALKVRQSKMKLPSTGLIITFIWIYSFIVTCPPLFGWGEYVTEGPGISCSVDWQSTTWNSLLYTVFLFVVGFLVQLVVMIYSYRSIYLVIIKQARQRNLSASVKKAERRVGRMISVMIVCFMIAWVPYVIVALAKVFSAFLHQPSILAGLNDIYGYIPALLAKSSILYNPIIYAAFNTQFCPRKIIRSPNQVYVGGDSKKTVVSTRQTTLLATDSSNKVLGLTSRFGEGENSVIAHVPTVSENLPKETSKKL